ncbi:hypothetical protein J4Q44_G00039680 [Coregonus suidteri]|uniref:C-type lectin domain-containing protein n=1 Tax=Coregonus suidteri TaxID=861788 RepID=A0AAN8MEB5_9TELE
MSEGVYENSDRFEDGEPNAMNNTDIDDQLYGNLRAFKPSPRDVASEQTCPEGWQKFESSWYFLSTETKAWKESREDCLVRGADLVIINSEKEKTFLINLKKRVWIGLTDSANEGTWRWVDGTQLTTGYGYDVQPDSQGPSGEEDCAEMNTNRLDPLEVWNDLTCEDYSH